MKFTGDTLKLVFLYDDNGKFAAFDLKKISTHLLTVIIMLAILQIEQRKRDKRNEEMSSQKRSESRVPLAYNT